MKLDETRDSRLTGETLDYDIIDFQENNGAILLLRPEAPWH